MGKAKKRLSKKSKAILKMVQESKELDHLKTVAKAKADSTFEPPSKSAKTGMAHRPRPHKKRGG